MRSLVPASLLVALIAVSAEAKSVEEVYRAARPAVVVITSGDALGSGFVVDGKGLVVTNNHVVLGPSVLVKLEARKDAVAAEVVARDPDRDLAVLALPPGRTYKFLPLATSAARVGQEIAVIGNPQGLEATVSAGNVSGMRDLGNGISLIQISAPISPGSSGGPVLDLEGRVIGVATAQLIDGQNLNFAVPISTAMALLKNARQVAAGPPAIAAQPVAASSAASLTAWFKAFQTASSELMKGMADTRTPGDAPPSIDPKFYAAVETITGLRDDLDRGECRCRS